LWNVILDEKNMKKCAKSSESMKKMKKHKKVCKMFRKYFNRDFFICEGKKAKWESGCKSDSKGLLCRSTKTDECNVIEIIK